ncbi:MAG TPA: hypothetical protein VJ937_01710 [Salinivirga sp.]|uniref:hypothetical protein n=1 Tax=Salinivirga sp. TaxID=1970192 RepID=UPI002B488820|nr:hypothetical protein [Salinivirga sp.]HKK58169.1 hypothetical protein [Salinivirga sp.]
MKNVYLIIIILILTFEIDALGQFSTKTEYLYLKHINTQSNKLLMKQNIFDVEKTLFHIIKNDPTGTYNGHFLSEAGRFYHKMNIPQKSYICYSLQKALYPNDSIASYHERYYKTAAMQTGLSLKQIEKTDSLLAQIGPSANGSYIMWLRIMVFQFNKKNTETLYKLSQINEQKHALPPWLMHWQFLTTINIKEKNKSEILQIQLSDKPIFEQVDNKISKKVFRKAIRTRIKQNAKAEGKRLLKKYKQKHNSFSDHLAQTIFSIRLF